MALFGEVILQSFENHVLGMDVLMHFFKLVHVFYVDIV